MSQHELASKLAANRTQFFALLDELEAAACVSLDERELESTLDGEYFGRVSVTAEEADHIIRRASHVKLRVVR